MLESIYVREPVAWSSDRSLYGDVPSAVMEAVLYMVVMMYILIGVIL